MKANLATETYHCIYNRGINENGDKRRQGSNFKPCLRCNVVTYKNRIGSKSQKA